VADDDRSLAGLPRKTLKIALPTLAALGAGTAFAVAAIPDQDGTIHGCYRTDTDSSGFPGGLRVIDGSNECGNNEKALNWNQQGVPGPQGPKGDQGNKGDQGDDAQTPAEQPVAQAFLKIDGIGGSSQDKAHKGEIEVRSFSWGSFRVGSSGAGSGGGGASKAKFRDFHFTKKHDRASTKLFRASATGQHFKSAELSVVENGQETISYKLTDITVETFDSSDGIFGSSESISVAPQKVELTFHDGPSVLTSSFDVKNNKKPVINSFSFKSSPR
jgi:type VI secretion system secreted protein Hcp